MSQPIRGIVVCVGYDDLLSITLVRNMRHLSECYVITSHDDERTQALCCSVPDVHVIKTDAFTRHGALFNKGLAIEESFDVIGRTGWLLIHDADILFPDTLLLPSLNCQTLYGAPRLILQDPKKWHVGYDWATAQRSIDHGHPGYFQLFNAGDPAIATLRPWYDVSFAHAGGSDAFFESHWQPAQKTKIASQVLHLGPRDANWFGRVTARTDGDPVVEAASRSAQMQSLLVKNGWRSGKVTTPVIDRVTVPGYSESTFRQGRTK